MAKKLYIKTYGCQMNVYDSIRMADVMAPLGYTSTDSADDADMVILNTCHIREKAETKVYSDLGRLRRQRKEKLEAGKDMIIAVGGCVGQAEGDEIIKRAPFVDMVFGPQSYHNLPEMLARTQNGERGVVDLDFAPEPKFDALPAPTTNGPSAFLSIQEGCDQFCTFCVVPYTRGAEYSRAPEPIISEARKLVAAGAKEITLLGQNVNAYHGVGESGKDWTLAGLIRAIAEIPGLARIRYTTSHPLDMTDDLIAAHGEVETLMPFLHLPVQSGADNILKKMNRKHDAAYYLGVIEKLRAARADIAFSSDFIIGFPGETDKDFAASMRLIETVGYAQAYSFTYSPRPGTPAATSDEQIDEGIKKARLQELQALISRQQLSFNQRSIGLTMPVLFDRTGKLEGQVLGKTPYMQSVYMQEPQLAGKIAEVTFTQGWQNSLTGVLAKDNAEQRQASV